MNSVSVIIPFYNNSVFLNNCLQSIYVQNIEKIDIIIIDDKSQVPPNQDVIKKYINLGLDIKIIHLKKNLGPGRARFIGINESKSDFIAFLDSDDEWFQDKLNVQLNILKSKNVDCVASKIIDREMKTLATYERGLFLSTETFLKDLLDQKISIPMSTIIINRDILVEKIKFFHKKNIFNLDHFELLLIVSSLNFYFINTPYAYYNLHNSNISKRNNYNIHYTLVLLNFFRKNFNSNKNIYLQYSFKYFFKAIKNVFK
ncbi:MAG: glycosyltransferase [Chitinophagaceae bacterium]|nr:glycosyltransferase [Chitinophagaceae bacterium]